MDLTEYTRHTLQGLQGVVVVVESIKSDAEADGLLATDLQAETELKLSQAGIAVLAQDQWSQTPGRPWLYVSVNTMKYLASYFFSIDVQLKQEVSLPREPSLVTSSATWEVGSIGFVISPDLSQKIRDSVSGYVNHFIRDFLAANGKLT
ncbi:MAG: hypothetical protein HY914_03435 [Desulfomonile tiedjei]|nr:hypothetical protein [Desulfomonile tiedjei]